METLIEEDTMVASEPEMDNLTTPTEDVDRIVRNHVLISVGIGLLPVPLIDLFGVAAVQLNMMRRLSRAYGTLFSQSIGKSVIASLVGGSLASSVSITLLKAVPILGSAAAMLTSSVTAGASTFALGKVFIQHFASGGTFLTFDPEKVRAYYRKKFIEGEQVAARMKARLAGAETER